MVTPTPPPATAAPAYSRRAPWVLAGFFAAYFALQLPGLNTRSATFDEPIHLAAGYLALAESDYRLDFTHPPLLRMWAALPLLGRAETPVDPARLGEWNAKNRNRKSYAFGSQFLYGGPAPDDWLNRARAMNLFTGALLGLLLFAWIRDGLGFMPAVLGLLLYLFEPNLAAHASLVTTDMGVTCFFFGAAYFLWRTVRRGAWIDIAGLALFVALAAASKFSAVLLWPALILVLALAVARAGLSWQRAAGILALVVATTWLALWAVYGFRYLPAAAGAAGAVEALPAASRGHLTWLGALIAWIDGHHLLPAAFIRGFWLNLVSAERLPGFLAGEISTSGWWYYFPVAFLIKTPLTVIALAGAGIVVLIRRRAAWGVLLPGCLLIPSAVYLAAAMSTEINIGLRHILPLYPFVLMLAALVIDAVLRAPWRRRTQALALGLPLVAALLAYARTWPDHLTFFNSLVGGPANGRHYLVDSNQDWGQHLKLLKPWMDENQVELVNLAYFGSVDPDYLGIKDVPLPGSVDFSENAAEPPRLPGYVAISSTLISGVYLSPEMRLFYQGFGQLEPVATLGQTIHLYRVERWPVALAPPDAPASEVEMHGRLGWVLMRLGWQDHALPHFERFLEQNPNDGRVLLLLGQLHARRGRADQALPLIRRAVDAEPEVAESRGALASLLLARGDFTGALPHAEACVRLQPANPHAHVLLGQTLAANLQLKPAVLAFRRALRLAPGDRAIRDKLQTTLALLDRDSIQP